MIVDQLMNLLLLLLATLASMLPDSAQQWGMAGADEGIMTAILKFNSIIPIGGPMIAAAGVLSFMFVFAGVRFLQAGWKMLPLT